MQTLGRDLEYGARTLARNPSFTLIAAATIALGIGASTAIFSVVNGVLLRPLPYADADRLVLVWADLRAREAVDFLSPPGDLHDLREQAPAFEDVGAVANFRGTISGDDGEPAQIRFAGVTTNLFGVLGAPIVLGRDFTEADGALPPVDSAGDFLPVPAMAIVSHGFWQRRYGGDPGVLGRMIEVNGQPAEIVGVLAPEFELLFPPNANVDRVPDVYAAMRLDYANASRINVFLRMIGRLQPGVSLAVAQAQADAVATDLRRRFPIKETAGLHFRVERMHEDLVADVRPAILALMGAVVFVLLIACANVANLLLVRASLRERELAVRAALGGSRARLVRQMLTESFLLALLGAIPALLLARLGIRLLVALRPDNLPRIESIRMDPAVLAFTTLAAFGAALLFGIVPALRASRVDVAETLREAGRSPGLAGARALQKGVIVAEVALSFVLLIGSGLMLRSFVELHRADPGYDTDGVLTFVANPGPARWPGPERRAVYMDLLRERLAALPGVTAVTAAGPLPLDGTPNVGARWGREDALADPNRFQQGDLRWVLPGYFEAMGTRVVAGRTFTDADNVPEATLVVIDEPFARKAFPGESPIGKRFLARVRTNEPEWFEVIGVVEHQRAISLAADSREAMFFTDAVGGYGRAQRWAVRTEGDPERLVSAVRAAVAEIDAAVPVAEVQAMSVLVDRARAPTRFALVLITVFAAIAAVLATVGLYGVLATMVRQRTPEIGVRMAFGAPRRSIFRLVVVQGARLGLAGIALGVLAAFALTHLMNSLLVGVAPTDAATFAAVAALFFTVAVAACLVPARRAAALEPTAALREE